MIARICCLVAACCVSIYWLTVAIKCIRISRVIRKDPNVIPRERTGQLLRLVWMPVLGTWIAWPWLHLHVAAGYMNDRWEMFAIPGALVCVFALAATFHCWREMGTSWRIGIDPGEKTALIVSGAYRYVRHPIYALSILLVWGTLAAAPGVVMLAVACIHGVLMFNEATREEKYMLRAHGQVYTDYMKTSGRFIPRF